MSLKEKRLIITSFCHKRGCQQMQCRELKKWLSMLAKGQTSSFTLTCALPRPPKPKPRYYKGIVKFRTRSSRHKNDRVGSRRGRGRSGHRSNVPPSCKTSVKCPRSECSYVTTSNHGLRRHLVAHDNKNHHSRHCRRCQESGDGVIHSIHCQERPFVCQFCDFRYKIWASLQIHLKSVHADKKTVEESSSQDGKDQEKYDTVNSWRRRCRQRRAKNDNFDTHPCSVNGCKFERDDEKKLAHHLLHVHKLPGLVINRVDARGPGRRPFVCQVCKIHLKFLQSLILHMEKFHSMEQNETKQVHDKNEDRNDDKDDESQNSNDDGSEWQASSSSFSSSAQESESEEDEYDDIGSENSNQNSIQVCDLTRDSDDDDKEQSNQTDSRPRTRRSGASKIGPPERHRPRTRSQSACTLREPRKEKNNFLFQVTGQDGLNCIQGRRKN